MKKTKEQNKLEEKIEEQENVIEKILKFDSMEDAYEIERVALGRKFCKKGERLQDICFEEIENYVCKNSKNIILKLYLHYKNKKDKNKFLLESRTTSIIRKVAKEILNNVKDIQSIEETYIIEQVKNIIIEQVKEYKRQKINVK